MTKHFTHCPYLSKQVSPPSEFLNEAKVDVSFPRRLETLRTRQAQGHPVTTPGGRDTASCLPHSRRRPVTSRHFRAKELELTSHVLSPGSGRVQLGPAGQAHTSHGTDGYLQTQTQHRGSPRVPVTDAMVKMAQQQLREGWAAPHEPGI